MGDNTGLSLNRNRIYDQMTIEVPNFIYETSNLNLYPIIFAAINNLHTLPGHKYLNT